MVLENKKIIITGGAGFIGSHLAEKLLEMNNEVLIYDNLRNYQSWVDLFLKRIIKTENARFINNDILDLKSLTSAVKQCEIIFHLAAQPGVRYSIDNPITTHNINTLGTLNVLEAAKEANVEVVINASTSSVYGEQQIFPIKEDAIKNPISPYGASKLLGEYYCRLYSNLFDIKTISLRYFTVYGPRQRRDMAFSRFINNILSKKPISIFGSGNQMRDFTYVSDVVNGTILAANSKKCWGEEYNIGGGCSIKLMQVVEIFQNIVGSFEINFETEKKGDVSKTHADISKARKYFSYDPKISTSKGLEYFINWFKNNL